MFSHITSHFENIFQFGNVITMEKKDVLKLDVKNKSKL